MENTASAGVCQYCGKALTPRELIFGDIKHLSFEPCECDGAREAREKAAEEVRKLEEEERWQQLNRRYDLAGIPLEHRRYNHPLTNEEAAIVRTGRGLYIVGDVGRGKSTLACSIGRLLIAQGMTCVKFLAAVDLPSMIRATYKRGSDETEDDLIRRYACCNLLILDDLGKGKSTDFAVSALFQIIDKRTRDLKPTIITSQYERDALAEWMARSVDRETAESLASRLAGHCERILIEGEDLRISGKSAAN